VNKSERVVAKAREYVEARRYFHEVARYQESLKQTVETRKLQAKSEEERNKIEVEHLDDINRSNYEVLERTTPPILALNDLVEADDEPVYFEHEGRELMVIPREGEELSDQAFEVRARDGGPETAM
jgi:hypothetical protein